MQQDVLFIHGWWAGNWVWSKVVARFEAARFQTHTLTLPGPESDRSTFSDNLRYALSAARAIGNPILVGHSAGGLIVMKMGEAIQPPACIAITPAGVLPRPSLLQLRFLLAAMPSIILGHDFFPRVLLRRIALNLLDTKEQDSVLEKMRPVSASQVRMIVPSLIGVDRVRKYSPLLIVGASEDRLTPAVQTYAIARRYGADYREYPSAAHYILLEQACSDMTSDLIAWLSEKNPGKQALLTQG